MKTYFLISFFLLILSWFGIIILNGYGISTKVGDTIWLDITCSILIINVIVSMFLLIRKHF